MKKKLAISTIMIVVVALLLVFGLLYVIMMLRQSYRIRQFDNDLWVAVNESKLCIAESDDGKVIVTKENRSAIYSLPIREKRKIVLNNPEAADSVRFTFQSSEAAWELLVELIDEETIRITLEGENSYCFYFENSDKFQTYKRIGSKEGLNEENMPVPDSGN